MSDHPRGVYEKVPGSGIWWVRYADGTGRIRREKIGTKSAAIILYQKRKLAVLQGEKLPENLKAKAVRFTVLADDALAYSEGHKRSYRDDKCRMAFVREEFGNYPAEQITPQHIESWLDSEEDWSIATRNRYLALIKLTYRLAERNGKVKVNPARLVRMRKENNARVRYLNQHKPLATDVDYLKKCKDEESRLLAVIRKEHSFHLAEVLIALNTGMRRGEQYGTEWPNVNFERKMLTVPRSKHGEVRHIPLNTAALAALKSLLSNMANSNYVFQTKDGHDFLRGNKHWFEDAVEKAGLSDFRWHDLRHTFASRLVMAGVDLRTVQELMGHRNISMTVRYAHLAPAHQLAAVEKLCNTKRATDTRTDTSRTRSL